MSQKNANARLCWINNYWKWHSGPTEDILQNKSLQLNPKTQKNILICRFNCRFHTYRDTPVPPQSINTCLSRTACLSLETRTITGCMCPCHRKFYKHCTKTTTTANNIVILNLLFLLAVLWVREALHPPERKWQRHCHILFVLWNVKLCTCEVTAPWVQACQENHRLHALPWAPWQIQELAPLV